MDIKVKTYKITIFTRAGNRYDKTVEVPPNQLIVEMADMAKTVVNKAKSVRSIHIYYGTSSQRDYGVSQQWRIFRKTAYNNYK